MNIRSFVIPIVVLSLAGIINSCNLSSDSLKDDVINSLRKSELARAEFYMDLNPLTVTAASCNRSAGGVHDFYSEGDYWWPDPKDRDGKYIRKDGQSNPHNFSDHRHAMVRLSEVVATLTSAWILTGEQSYADKALEHLDAWFVDTSTMMNPHMLYAQAIWGRYTGRGIGLIDAYHFVEVARSVKLLSDKGGISSEYSMKIKKWFSRFLGWMTTHEYGISEMNTENNHAVCWAATASSMAVLTDNEEVIELCKSRFKEVLLPSQMAEDGSFPRELKRTKPYGYSLFNIDAFCIVAEILSTPEDNLWEFETPEGRSLRKGMEFIFPYISDKSLWPFEEDIFIWDEWPACHPAVLFSGLAYENEEYIETYVKLPAHPTHPEVLRNLPVRHPIVWIEN